MSMSAEKYRLIKAEIMPRYDALKEAVHAAHSQDADSQEAVMKYLVCELDKMSYDELYVIASEVSCRG